VSEFDKAMIVAKLKDASDRVRRAHQAKCEGRKACAERQGGLVALARQLRGNPNSRPQSVRRIAADLAKRGYITRSGRSYIASMLGETWPPVIIKRHAGGKRCPGSIRGDVPARKYLPGTRGVALSRRPVVEVREVASH
jgi:hypothetical protein